MGGLLHRRGGEGLNVTVDATPSVDVHRPRSLREPRRPSPYGRVSPYEAAPRRKQLPPLQLAPLQQLAPTLPTPGTQLNNAIGGLALAPISARTRRATKAWARPSAAQPSAARQHAARQHAARHARSPARETAQAGGGGGAEFDAYLKLHGFTTERTPEEKKKKEKKEKKRTSPGASSSAAGPSFVPPLQFVPPPTLVPQPPPPEVGRVPAKLAAVRAARGKRRLRAETITLDEEQQHSADQAHMANMIKMLRQFDAPPPPPRKPPPNTDLTLVELAELRARMVAAMGEACASGRGQPGQPAAAVARVRVTSLARHQLGRFLMLLAPRRKQQQQQLGPDDNEWMLDRLWAVTDVDKQGGLSEDELLQGLGGAFNRSLAARLRWNWQTFYDVGQRGELSAHAIFGLLSQVPVGSRLEEDALLLCRLASTKLTYGQRAAVTLAEYTAHYTNAAEDEPDALGLRRRRPQQRQNAEAVRARARFHDSFRDSFRDSFQGLV